MAALEALTEEESYLYAILTDRSGIDQAEFSWTARENDDLCFRAWHFQHPWWRNDDPLTIDQAARSLGKSTGITVRMFAFPFIFPGQDALITAPELIHLEPVVNLIENRFKDVRLGREMIRKQFTHRPFLAEFSNGARILGRIPQKTGAGIKGAHPLWLEQDEAQNYPQNGWTELIETLKRGTSDASWRAHGVTRGVRDQFYTNSIHAAAEKTLRPASHKGTGGWTVHKIPAMARPTWSDAEREEKIQQYGSKDDPDYRRNVLGAHGDSQSNIFVLSRLMKNVDDNLGSDFNNEEYWRFSIKDSELEAQGGDLIALLDPPRSHLSYKSVWIGADLGWAKDPTEIVIFAEYDPKEPEKRLQEPGKAWPDHGASRLKMIGRVSLQRISTPDQAEVIISLVDFYKPRAFAMDSTGAGLPLFQDVQNRMNVIASRDNNARARRAAESIKGYNFSGKYLVEFDETVELDPGATTEERIREAGITQFFYDASTDTIRTYIDNNRLWLPWDRDFIGQMQSQTVSNRGAGGRRIYSSGTFHALDAMRLAIFAHKQHTIEELTAVKAEPTAPVLDYFITDSFFR